MLLATNAEYSRSVLSFDLPAARVVVDGVADGKAVDMRGGGDDEMGPQMEAEAEKDVCRGCCFLPADFGRSLSSSLWPNEENGNAGVTDEAEEEEEEEEEIDLTDGYAGSSYSSSALP